MEPDNIVTFLQNEHRAGFLLANPDEVCTIAFLEHLAAFIEKQCQCLICDAAMNEYARQVGRLRQRGDSR